MGNLTALFVELTIEMTKSVVEALSHNWFTLSLAIFTVAILRAYIDPEKLKLKLLEKPKVSILGSVAFGTFTPLCAAGTLGLVVGLLTTVLPWGPIMAFLTSSPLMSPDGFIMVAGVISLEFATALALASIAIGLGSGYVTHLIETKTDFLKNQTRFFEKMPVQTSCCNAPDLVPAPTCSCSDPDSILGQVCYGKIQTVATTNTGASIFFKCLEFLQKIKWRKIGEYVINIGIKNILLYFSIFVAVGYLINRFVPTSIIASLLGVKKITAVPLASLIGLPLYITTEASIPLIKALMAQGAGGGAMLAFWITGQTTSAWVLVGLATFMKKRVISLYILYIMLGGIFCGYLYDLYLVIGK